jgi:hypothetical protein
MIRICYSIHHIGDRKFGEKEPLEDKRETHGLCDPCFREEIQDIEIALQEHRFAKVNAGVGGIIDHGST